MIRGALNGQKNYSNNIIVYTSILVLIFFHLYFHVIELLLYAVLQFSGSPVSK